MKGLWQGILQESGQFSEEFVAIQLMLDTMPFFELIPYLNLSMYQKRGLQKSEQCESVSGPYLIQTQCLQNSLFYEFIFWCFLHLFKLIFCEGALHLFKL